MQWLIDNYETAEGVSLPRSTLYYHYLRHCQEQGLDPMNPASFGKLIRSVFLGLRTRRLGTRLVYEQFLCVNDHFYSVNGEFNLTFNFCSKYLLIFTKCIMGKTASIIVKHICLTKQWVNIIMHCTNCFPCVCSLIPRGNSKYHYYGIRIRANSSLNQFTDDQTMALRQQPLYTSKKYVNFNIFFFKKLCVLFIN